MMSTKGNTILNNTTGAAILTHSPLVRLGWASKYFILILCRLSFMVHKNVSEIIRISQDLSRFYHFKFIMKVFLLDKFLLKINRI